MKAKTLEKLDSLNQRLQDLRRQWSGHTADQLNYRPEPGVWSALDNLQHLRLSEGLSHEYLKKKLKGNIEDIPKAGMSARLRAMGVTLFMRSGRKRQAPKMVDESSFPERSELTDILDQWHTQRQELRAFLEKQPEGVFEREAYRHPFAGRLSLLGMLRFFESHFERHFKQAEERLAAAREAEA